MGQNQQEDSHGKVQCVFYCVHVCDHWMVYAHTGLCVSYVGGYIVMREKIPDIVVPSLEGFQVGTVAFVLNVEDIPPPSIFASCPLPLPLPPS